MAQSTWQGTTNTDFATGTNWSTTPVAPAAGDTAIVNNGALANQPIVGASTTVNNLQVSAGTIGVAAAQTLTVTTLLDLSGTGTLNGPGIFAAGNVTISGGTVANGATVNTAGAFTITGGQLDGTLGGGGAFNVSAAFSQSATGVLAGAGGLTITGGTTTLLGANTYTGATNINGGVLNIQNAAGLGAGTGIPANGTVVAANAALQLQGGIIVANEALTLNGNGVANDGALRNISGDNNFSGPITLGSATRINSDAGTLFLNGAFNNAGNLLTVGGAGATAFSTTSSISGAGGLTKDGTGGLALDGTNSYTGVTTINAGLLQVNNGNAIADTGAVVVNGGFFQLAGSETIGSLAGLAGGTVNLNANTLTTGGDNTSTTFAGNFQAAAGALIKTGTGTFTLSGNNAHTGGTTINNGTLAVSADNNLGGAAGGVTLNGGTLQVNGTFSSARTITAASILGGIEVTGANNLTLTGTLNGAANFTKSGTGTLTFGAGLNTAGHTNGMTLAGGTLSLQTNLAAGFGTIQTTGSTIDYANGVNSAAPININSNTTALQVLAGTATQSGVISETGGPRPLEKIGAGTLILTGANTYSGTTTITAGALNAQNNTALGTGNVVVTAGAALQLQGGVTLANTITLNGTGVANDGALRNISGNNTINGLVTLASPSRINSDAGLLTLAGGITGAGQNVSFGGAGNVTVNSAIATGTGTLTKDGAGVLTLSGANTYTGTTTVNAGTLTLAGGAAIADAGAVVLNGTSILDLAASETIGSLAGVAGTTVNLNANSLTTGGDNSSTTYAGAITGTGGLTKEGTGNFTLSGANTYTGATQVNAGTLTLAGGAAIVDTGSIGVLGGATLAVTTNETIGSVAGLAGSAITLNGASLTTGGNNNTTTFAGNISGTGGLTKQGAGNFTLSGVNTYTGATQVNAGTLTLAGGAAIADSGAIGVLGGATLALAANETIGSVAGLAGSAITLGANTLTTGGNNNTTTFAGVISGTGGLTKEGTGTFTLSGANTYTGTTQVNAGVLANTGSLAGAIVTAAAGTVTNSGAIAGVVTNAGTFTNNAGGTVAGLFTNSGTLANNAGGILNGGLTQTAGTSTNAGTINAGATINGGTLTTTGTVNGGLTAAAGSTVNAAGTINGGVTNAGAFTVTALLSNGGAAFTNNNPGTLTLNAGQTFNNITTLTNNSASANAVLVNAGATLITTASIANNAGTFANSGAITALTFTNAAIFNNNATGTLTGALTQSAGTTTNAGTITGLFTLNGGTLTSTGTLGGGLTSAAGTTVAAQGTLNGAVANAGSFNVTGNLAGNNVFGNTGIVNLTGGNITGLTAFNNNGTLNVAGTRTLGATAFANQAAGVIAMQNGATTDSLTIGGTFAGTAGSRVSYDVNLAAGAQAADRVTVAGLASGATTLNFTAVNTAREVLAAPLNVFVAAAGSPVALNTGVVASLSGGFVDYFLQESAPGSGTFQLVSAVNTGPIAAVSTSLSSTVTAISTGFHQPASAIVSRPDRPSNFSLFGDQRPGARDQVVPPPGGARDPVTRVQTPVTSTTAGCNPNQLMGGPFARIAAGDSKIDASGRGDRVGGGLPLSGSSRTNTDFQGIQGGIDAGICNIQGSGWNIHVGVMGGFVRATAKSNASGAGVANVNTTAKVDAPFVGLYSFLTNGPFTAEVSVRRDFYDARVTTPNPALGGFFVAPNTKVKGDGTSLNTSLAYRIALGEQFYVEPQVGFSFGQTDFGRLPFATGANDVMTFRATESLLGRIGANFGAAFAVTDTLIIAPFGHISIWREMGKGSKTRTTLGSIGGQSFDFKTQRVGTFGQAGAGLQFKLDGTPFLGFIRGDLRFGSRIEAKAVNVGLRAQF